MKFLQNISEKLGLTQTELKVIFFLLGVFLIGIIIKSFGWKNDDPDKAKFDYSAVDSIFYSAKVTHAELQTNIGSVTDPVSSNISKSNLTIKKQQLAEKSININKASIEQLSMLPGIGSKTAERILAYRRANGGFSNINQLLEIKGIGDSKFEKIKKYIFIR